MEESFLRFLNHPEVRNAMALVIGVSVIWVIVKLIQRRLFSRVKDIDQRYRSKKVISFLGYIGTIILLTVIYLDQLSGLTIALGVAGAGVAFASQEVIASFAGWLAIMFGGFYKSGDRVQLGGIKGDVMDIGMLRTTIMETGQWIEGDLYNGRIVLVANSFVFKEPVFNYSGDFPFLWDEIHILVQFGSHYEKLKEIMMKAGKEVAGDLSAQSKAQWDILQQKFRLEDAQTEPMVSILVKDNAVQFTLRYVVNYKRRRWMKTQLYTQIIEGIENSQEQIKFVTATLNIVEAPELKIKLNSGREEKG
jgi:small-conductance mechanosensitive channel